MHCLWEGWPAQANVQIRKLHPSFVVDHKPTRQRPAWLHFAPDVHQPCAHTLTISFSSAMARGRSFLALKMATFLFCSMEFPGSALRTLSYKSRAPSSLWQPIPSHGYVITCCSTYSLSTSFQEHPSESGNTNTVGKLLIQSKQTALYGETALKVNAS